MLKDYEVWLNSSKLEADEKKVILEYSNDEKALAFDTDLEFGTAGMRALLGVGTAYLNKYTVQKATLGLARYLTAKYDNNIKVAIGYDSRHMSYEFSCFVAQVLATYNIKSLIFDQVKPTPMLSFLVREKNCQAGIMITASHNPKEYNGYKVYGQDGAQLNLDDANALISQVNAIENILDEEFVSDYNSFVTYIDESFDDVYLKAIDDLPKTNKQSKDLKIVFTPVNGTSHIIMPKALNAFGFKNVICVEEQMLPDPNFTNCPSSNPEEELCYELALKYAKEHDADLIIANDPDADRLGVMYKTSNGYEALSGNQTGSLLIDYLTTDLKNPEDKYVYKTVVTGELGALIAKNRGFNVVETLTGFKFIGEQILGLTDAKAQLVMGYEESYGYLISPIARDKDAISAAIVLSQMAQDYKDQGLTLGDKLAKLYDENGYYFELTHSITLQGQKGLAIIKDVMNHYRTTTITDVAGINVTKKVDYLEGIDNLPSADVVKFYLENCGWFVLRPSGTEPKLKVYVSINADTEDQAKVIDQEVFKAVTDLIDQM